MPDQSSAADEHALLEEITAPLERLPEQPPVSSGHVDFPIVRRGYDRFAVDEHVRRTNQLVEELQASGSPSAAVRRAVEQVGEQVSGILQRAHDTAAQLTTQSRAEAEDRLVVARADAAQLITDSEQRLRELDAETDRIWGERRRIVEDARQLAQELLGLADAAVERFPAAGDTGEETLALPSGPAADAPGPDRELDQTVTFDPRAPERTEEPHPDDTAEAPPKT